MSGARHTGAKSPTSFSTRTLSVGAGAGCDRYAAYGVDRLASVMGPKRTDPSVHTSADRDPQQCLSDDGSRTKKRLLVWDDLSLKTR